MFLRIFQHLLPGGRAWLITVNKYLRQFFEGLANSVGSPVKQYLDEIYLDLFPDTTRELEAWENQFNLLPSVLTVQERRDRLAATWKMRGGQSPSYIQKTLQAAGFDVYVHEWWEPGTEPGVGVHATATVRIPSTVLFTTSTAQQATVQCGEPLAQCGEPTAQCGNVTSTLGYPLVNKVFSANINYTTSCGEPLAQCGEPLARCGENDGIIYQPVVYTIPANPIYWPYFLYIGGEVFGELAAMSSARRDDFEALCLKICPAQQWLGIMVAYT